MLDLDRLVADCRDALTQDHAEAMIRDLVARAVAERSAAEAALGRPSRGALFTIHHLAELTILTVVWAPGMAIELLGGPSCMPSRIPWERSRERSTCTGGDFFATPRGEWTPGHARRAPVRHMRV